MSDNTVNDPILEDLLKKSHNNSVVLPEELAYLVTAFVPSQQPALRSKAYLVLSAFCQGVRSSAAGEKAGEKGDLVDTATASLVKVFQPLIVTRLGEQQEQEALAGLSFFFALFQVDWQSASYIFQQDGIIEFLTDTVDLFSTPQVSLELAHLLGQASGHKACRMLCSAEITDWLRSTSRQKGDAALQAASAIALIKLSRGLAADTAENTESTSQPSGDLIDEDLTKVLKEMITSGEDNESTTTEVVEGLAYLSVDPTVKETLAKDPKFLKQLYALVPERKGVPRSAINSTLLYGILVITSNLCAHRPRLSQEEAQIAKLRDMTKSGTRSTHGSAEDPLDDDSHVKARARALIASGALKALSVASGLESHGVRLAAGKVFLNLVEDKENRGKVLQGGGAKSLARIVRPATSSSPASPASRVITVTDLPAIQALAKLAITASPVQVFGPDEGAIYDAIYPLSQMVLHDSSSLLQQFEALMALTNISSQSTACATHIAATDNLLNKVELLILDDHTLIRRAATELICNLIAGSDAVFMRFGGGQDAQASKSKLQVLLAMSDVDDLPTRLAAAGALAIVTNAPPACHALLELQLERHRVFPILAQLVDPAFNLNGENATDIKGDAGLVHRGVVCLRNMLLNSQDSLPTKSLAEETERSKLVDLFVSVLKGKGGPYDTTVLHPAAEILKFLVELRKMVGKA